MLSQLLPLHPCCTLYTAPMLIPAGTAPQRSRPVDFDTLHAPRSRPAHRGGEGGEEAEKGWSRAVGPRTGRRPAHRQTTRAQQGSNNRSVPSPRLSPRALSHILPPCPRPSVPPRPAVAQGRVAPRRSRSNRPVEPGFRGQGRPAKAGPGGDDQGEHGPPGSTVDPLTVGAIRPSAHAGVAAAPPLMRASLPPLRSCGRRCRPSAHAGVAAGSARGRALLREAPEQCACVCSCACVRACMHACVCVCVRVRARMRAGSVHREVPVAWRGACAMRRP
jgi:hypothetical protein